MQTVPVIEQIYNTFGGWDMQISRVGLFQRQCLIRKNLSRDFTAPWMDFHIPVFVKNTLR